MGRTRFSYMKSVNAQSSNELDGPFFGKNTDSVTEQRYQGQRSTPFFSGGVQAKLTVGPSDDPQEKEADTMADKVVQRQSLQQIDTAAPFFRVGINHPVQRKCAACEEEERSKENEEEEIQPKREEKKEDESLVQPKCETCEKEEEVQAKRSGDEGEASEAIGHQLESSKGSGNRLPAGVKDEMNSSFGADFSNVKVHTDNNAAGMSRQLGAQAFTHGNDIYFNEGKYNPGNESGKHLLAHELTHTIQQGAADTTIRKQDATPPPPAGTVPASTPAPAVSTVPVFIAEDTATPAANQLRKTDFVNRLNREVCATVDDVLAGTPFSSESCSYITRAFQHLFTRTPSEIEAILKRYEPRLREATTLQQFFDIIRERVRTTVAVWLQNGDLSGLPPEITSQIPERFRVMAGMAGSAANLLGNVREGFNNVVSGAGSVLADIGSIFFKSKGGEAQAVHSPAAVTQQLGKGQTIPADTRSRMEGAFNTDFSGVEIHTDSRAAELSQDMNARAFTLGRHVAFGSHEYQPGTLAGDALIAHELAHVQQQKDATGTAKLKSRQPDEQPLEEEADETAIGVVGRLLGGKNKEFNEQASKGLPKLKSGLQLQRCCGGASWDGNVSAIRIEVYTTSSMNEPPVDPGQAIIADFPSFAVRLNTHQYSPPTPVTFTMTRVGDPSFNDVRVPSSHGISRFMRPPSGTYIIAADVMTGLPQIPRARVERRLEIIGTLGALSNAQAPGDLHNQAGQTLQSNLIGAESMATVLRRNAVAAAGVPADLVEAWDAANGQAILVEGAITNPTINPAVNTAAKDALTRFYRRLRTEIAGRDVVTHHQQQGRGAYIPPTTTNPFQTQQQTDTNINALARGGASAAEWRSYLNTFYSVTNSLNQYVAERLQTAGFSEAAAQLRVAGPVSGHLRQLYRDHPDAKPVQAVFYPKLQTNLRNDAAAGAEPHYTLVGLPQRMYTYRTTDGIWHLLDITRPERPFQTEESGGSEILPPNSLITELNSPERFPQGILHWQFEGGARSSTEMTHPWTMSEVLNLISGVLALAGIMALIAGSGGTAAPALIPTLCFVASGVIGAAGAAAHMRESSELGTLTTQTIVVDSLMIAANLLSAGMAGTGHIVRAAQASEAAWTGWRGLSALGAQAVYRPIQLAALGTDFASLAALSAQTLEQFNQIQAMPAGEARTMAMQRLVVQSLLTGGMTLISIRGGMHDIGARRTLYLDFTTINGVRTPVAHRVMPQGELLSHPRLGTARADAEAYLQRTDVDGALADQFRGELSVGLSTAGISEAEISAFVQRMRSASAAEARQILQEFRNNRIRVSVGGVSRSDGYDLTYFHTSPADFQASVQQAFAAEGTIGHNGRLSHPEGAELSQYHLQVDGPNGTRVDADVQIVYQDFAAGSAIGAGTSAPGAAQGPARNTVIWDATANRWRVRVEVDQRLAPGDIRRAVGHELDEAGDVINRLHGSQGPDIQERISALQRPGMFTAGGGITSHDFATLREINLLLQGARSGNARAGEALSILLHDIGLMADAAQLDSRLARIMSSGAVDATHAIPLEWAARTGGAVNAAFRTFAHVPVHLQNQLTQILRDANFDLAFKTNLINEISDAIASGRVPLNDIASVVGSVNDAAARGKDILLGGQEALAELASANRVAREGGVTTVRVNAEAGTDYDLGNGITTRIDPISEVDNLFARETGTGAARAMTIFAYEVKNTIRALLNKLRKTPQQLRNMVTWRGAATAANPRAIKVVVESESHWTEIFSTVGDRSSPRLSQEIAAQGVPLRLGSHELTSAQVGQFDLAVYNFWVAQGRPRFADFLARPEFANVETALRFFGIL